MRLLEVSNSYNIIIPNEYCYLRVGYMDYKFYIISPDNKNVKVKFKNKTLLFYKDFSGFSKVSRIEYVDKNSAVRYKPNFIGFFNTNDGVLIKSRQYSGIISIWDIIKLLTS